MTRTPNTTPQGQSCGTCRFAGTNVLAGAETREQVLVRCRRFPPRRLGNVSPAYDNELVAQHGDTRWPVLTWDDWCGEWVKRDIPSPRARKPA